MMPLIRALALVASVVCFASAAEDGAAVAGTLSDLAGARVPNAAVELQAARDRSVVSRTLSDEEGMFSFTGLAEGDYDLRVTAPGFTGLRIRLGHLDRGERKVGMALPMDIASSGYCGGPRGDYLRFIGDPDRGELHGTVTRAPEVSGGKAQPLAEVVVSLLCDGAVCNFTRTDFRGEFFFLGLRPGRYKLRFLRDGFYGYEQQGYEIKSGFASYYFPEELDACPNGNCDPKLCPAKPVIVCE